MPTLIETLDETILQAATDGVSSYSADGETTVATDPIKLMTLRKWAAEETAATLYPTGSAWGRVRMARAVPPGGGPR